MNQSSISNDTGSLGISFNYFWSNEWSEEMREYEDCYERCWWFGQAVRKIEKVLDEYDK